VKPGRGALVIVQLDEGLSAFLGWVSASVAQESHRFNSRLALQILFAAIRGPAASIK
jgi:hypothetical protein